MSRRARLALLVVVILAAAVAVWTAALVALLLDALAVAREIGDSW